MSKEIKNKVVPKLRFPDFENSEGWEDNTLGSVCSNISSGKDKIDLNGKYSLYGSTGIIGNTTNCSYEGNYILVARVGANAGHLTRTQGKFGVTDNTLVISLFDKHNINFIHYSLEKSGLNKLVFGSGQPLITGGQLKSLSFHVPKPKEQQKIADCLSSLDELIGAENGQLQALKAHKKGLMQQLFPAEGETVPKLRFPEFRDSGEWEEKMLEELLLQGRLGGNYENSDTENGVPVIKMGNLNRGNININRLQYLPKGIQYNDDDILKKGDLLLNTRNTLELVGKVAIWNNELPKALYNSNLLRLTFHTSSISTNWFMNYCLNTEIMLAAIRGIATGTTSVAAIYTKDLLRLKLTVPNLKEQQKIADCLSALDERITAQAAKIEALKLHKKGLMQGLFPAVTGK